MLKNKSSISLILLTLLIICVQIVSCKKETVIETVTVAPPVCNVQGVYSGTSTTSTGSTATMTYRLQANNLATGSVTPTSPIVTFGGYRNTCDSVFISAYYSTNNSYYLLEGKLLNNSTTIAGTFKNVNTPTDFGTFSITR